MTDADDWPDPAALLAGLRTARGPADAVDWAGELLVAVDRAIGRQVAVVLAHVAPLEAAWRALAAVLAEAADAAVVQVADLTVLELADAADWLDRVLYAGPVDTRGGQPIGLLAVGDALAGAALVAVAVGERALCPVLHDDSPFLAAARPAAPLRPPLAADPTWAGWFDWPTPPDAHRPLVGGAALAVAAAVVRSVASTGWPVDASAAAVPALPRQLMANRFGHLAAARCRGSAGRPPADVAADVAEAIRGRFVGPRLPLAWVEVAVDAVPPGRLSCTLRLAPRLGGDDPDEVPVTLTVVVGGA